MIEGPMSVKSKWQLFWWRLRRTFFMRTTLVPLHVGKIKDKKQRKDAETNPGLIWIEDAEALLLSMHYNNMTLEEYISYCLEEYIKKNPPKGEEDGFGEDQSKRR